MYKNLHAEKKQVKEKNLNQKLKSKILELNNMIRERNNRTLVLNG